MAINYPADANVGFSVTLIHQGLHKFAAVSEAQLRADIDSIKLKKGVPDLTKFIQNELQEVFGVKWNKVNEITLINTLAANYGITISAAEANALSASANAVEIVKHFIQRSDVLAKVAAPADQFLQDAAAGTAVYGATGDLTDPAIVGGDGKVFALSAGIDTIDSADGNGGDDTIVGTSDQVTILDNIDGGKGDDTLLIGDVVAGGALFGLATIKNVEKLVYQDGEGGDDTIGLGAMTGLQTVEYQDLIGAGKVTINTKSNVTSVNVTGVSGSDLVTVDDQGGAGTDKLASVSVNGDVDVAVKSDVLTSLSLANSAGETAIVTAAAGTRHLKVNLDNVTTNVITDAEATTVTVDSSSNKSSASLSGVKATTINFTGNAAFELTGATFGAGLTTIAGSTQTGGLDLDAVTIGAGVSVTTGDGNDSVKIDATVNKAIALGKGDDTLEHTGTAFATGGSADGGDGTDTLNMTAANAATASGSAAFGGAISGFERLSVTASGTNTIDMANLDNISHVTEAGASADLVIKNFANSGTFVFSDASTKTTITLKDATGTSDVLNVELKSAAGGVDVGEVIAAGVETVNFKTTGTSIFNADLTDAAAKTITVVGNAGIDLNDVASGTAVTLFDASGVTGTGGTGSVLFTAGALTGAATIKGGAGNDTLDASAATKSVTMEGNAGNDFLIGSANADIINAGDGTNTVTGGLGGDTLTGGSGVDTYDYNAAAESSGVNTDTITNFKGGVGGDVLDLDTPFAAADFVYAGEALNFGAVLTSLVATKVVAVLDVSTSTLYIDATKDGTIGAGDMTINLTGVVDLDATNFFVA